MNFPTAETLALLGQIKIAKARLAEAESEAKLLGKDNRRLIAELAIVRNENKELENHNKILEKALNRIRRDPSSREEVWNTARLALEEVKGKP